MLKVKYERYITDYNRQMQEKEVRDLAELENWIFDQMQQDYTKERCMFFPTLEIMAKIRMTVPSAITFTPTFGGPKFSIKDIRNEYGGIIFSDGTFTSGQKYWNKSVQKWLSHCEERRKTPQFNFVEDEEIQPGIQEKPAQTQVEKVISNLASWANGNSCNGCPEKDDTVFQAVNLLRLAYLKNADQRTYMVTELCPHCESEIEMRWDTDQLGFKAFCPVCGKRLMLCDECQHCGDGNCDYSSETDSCRHNPSSK